MVRLSAAICAGLCALMLASISPAASAQTTASDRETARMLMIEGRKAESSGDFRKALDAYKGADAIMRVTTTGLSVAKMQAAVGLLVEAHDTAIRVARIPRATDEDSVIVQARGEAIALAAELDAKIPTVRVVVEGAPESASILLEIDGRMVPPNLSKYPRALNPGKHHIAVRAPGSKPVERDIVLKEGERNEVQVTLDPAAATDSGEPPPAKIASTGNASRPTPWITYAGFGVGAAGFVVGSATGLLTLSKASSIKNDCQDNRCPPSREDDGDSAKTLATISNVSFGIAAIGVGVGLYGLLSDEGQEAGSPDDRAVSTRVRPIVGLGAVGFEGAF